MLERLLDIPETPQEPIPPHNCADHVTHTNGALGWGWYCDLCGSFAPMDEITEG
jgi:hypothetical protein